ncbi:TM0106 family RecB-like putative nuclease [Corynebacterium pseudopelargi]|uniref:YprB ribonuclease H-like domain-containing protein n=1 Tax=Corynebacterium pseudopelargi TaxID=2080757 RepID=A0A3G6IRX9_9CORY|nr:TM0106 family RecB-like putative nuclease [Corynebacterium pseudopelargi]AZA08287.1 hypothetical protein CPPEL_00695 [Corynebacterium pseudopelargi]
MNDVQKPWAPHDLVGCRYRRVQQERFPDLPPTESSLARLERVEEAREAVMALLPTAPARGDAKRFIRIDARGDFFATLEALAADATMVTNAVLEGEDHDKPWQVHVDVLVRRAKQHYMPVIISNHRIARPDPNKEVPTIPTARLGLGQPRSVHAKIRHHAVDSYAVAMAARALERMGIACPEGGLIGQNRALAYIIATKNLQQGLDTTLQGPTPTHAHRVKECASCRFWPKCEAELQARDHVSLVLPGGRSSIYLEEGIESVQELIDANLGLPSRLAQAWRNHEPVLVTSEHPQHPRRDVEIDIDVEAYLDQGAYLWGTFDGHEYRPFATWGELGGVEEAENFARFWDWLMRRKAAAEGSFGVYCYSAHGENHWLKFSARRFHGKYPGVPSEQEVRDFIASDEWIDVFAQVKAQLAGPFGLGLKVVAPVAGYHWKDDIDGEASVDLYRQGARETLLRYNADDCKATAAVRRWLDAGAPGVPRA